MYLELITGGPGSGKSGYIENAIKQTVASNRKALIIVPERFSHIEEKTMCETFGGLGENGINVSTFSKLSKKLLSNENYLSKAGRQMLIMKAAKMNKDAGEGVFASSADKNGFLTGLSSTISELKRNLISPEELSQYSGGGLIEKKIHAVGEIYSSYNKLLDGGFNDPDEDMERLAQVIYNSERFTDTDFYIDGFSDFLPSHYAVIEALIAKSAGVYVTLMITDSGLRSNEGIFSVVRKCVSDLREIAAKLGVNCISKHFDKEPLYISAPDISYFIKTYDEFNPAYKKPVSENIRLVCLNDRHEEVSWLAGRIMHEVRENGLRFRDIGVIVGRLDTYAHIIDAVFEETGIAYFLDMKTAANEHPVIRLVLSVFKILKDDWSYSSVFEYLRSGFVYEKTQNGVRHILESDVDLLDIYVKTRGIRGKKLWLSQEDWKPKRAVIFDTDKSEESLIYTEKIDTIRRRFMEPFSKFYDKIKGRQKVSALCSALFEFLDDICLYDGLVYETKKLENAGMLNDAARISAVWNSLVETLEQCVLTGGDEFIKREDFALMLEAGLSECTVDTVPTGIDCVNILDASDSRPVRVKALFAVGAARGEFPAEVNDGGLINDKDRAELFANGFEALPDASSKNALAEFSIFHSLTGASQRLYVSYPAFNDDNTKNTPCELIFDIMRTFPEIEAGYPGDDERYENLFTSHKNTYYRMLSRLISDISSDERGFWKALSGHIRDKDRELVRTYFPQKTDYGSHSVFELADYKKRSIFEMIEAYKKPSYCIRPDTAELIYDASYMSITSMQLFNKCPFSHFVRYGLKVLPEEEYKLKSYELGQMIHHAINEFCQSVQKDAETLEEKKECWKKLDKTQAREIINVLMSGIEEKAKAYNPDFGEEKIESMCKRAAKTIENAVMVICDSIVSSGFSACDFEREFRFEIKNDDGSASVYGKIDRVDIAQRADGTYLRIIDYKTGQQEFNISGICNMTDIQLILYAMAAEDLYKNDSGKAAAVLYNKVREELSEGSVSEAFTAALSKLDGIIITEGKPEEAGQDELIMHDGALCTGGARSSYLPVRTKADGSLFKGKASISRERFKKLEDYVENGVIKTKKAVFEGDISVSPLTASNSSPCKYCGYEQICLFDLERDAERKAVTSETLAWEIIGGDSRDE